MFNSILRTAARSPSTGTLARRTISTGAKTQPAHLNFRSFVDQLREDGDLAEVDVEIDPYLEVGAITRKVYELPDKAPLFNNLKGMKDDGFFRILGAPGGLRKDPKEKWGRLARHLDLPVTCTAKDITDKILSAKDQPPIDPVVVPTGPCKENKIFGDDIDLNNIPAPFLHRSDGGKYIQTYGLHHIQTPDKRWTNWSIARAMIADKAHLTGMVSGFQHIGMVWNEWKDQGKDMPWALAFGVPPAAVMVGSMSIPKNVDEGGYIGALTGTPIDVVKCETNDILVPANAEIVLEGTISITETSDEGPMGEMHGYVWPGESRKCPTYKVNCITYRNNAILPVSVAGRAPDETHTLIGMMNAAEMRDVLQRNDFPVLDVWVPFESNVTWAVIKIDTIKLRALNISPKDFARKVGNLIFHTKVGVTIHRLLLVGDDIDIYNWEEVMWAFCTRCRPLVDEHNYEDVMGFPLVPYMSHGNGSKIHGGKVVSDCLFPDQFVKEVIFETANYEKNYPQEMKDKINANWNVMGFRG